jgi:hypothetical protein
VPLIKKTLNSNPDKPEPNRIAFHCPVKANRLYSGMLEFWNSGVLGLNSEKVYFLIKIGICDDFVSLLRRSSFSYEGRRAACGYDG